jgi:hypothetical protein
MSKQWYCDTRSSMVTVMLGAGLATLWLGGDTSTQIK